MKDDDNIIESPRSVLIVSVSGIGNTILAGPFVRALRDRFPNARIDLLVWGEAGAAPLKGSPYINDIWVAPRRLGGWVRLIGSLRRARYEVALTVFPSNQPLYHIFARLVGARARVSHAYRGGWRRFEWLETHRAPAREDLHDADQNLALLRCFGLDPAGVDRSPFFYVDEEARRFAGAWRQKAGLERTCLIGVHPGAGAAVTLQHWQGHWKRWPREHFAGLVARLAARPNVAVLLFGGPEEQALKEEVFRAAGAPEPVHVMNASLRNTAALLEQCDLMISNDSGLMHMAAAMGTPVLALFGPTQPTRTAPVGPGHRVLRKEGPGRPCLRYPFYTSRSKIRCPCRGDCLREITVDEVYQAACAMLEGGKTDDRADCRADVL